MSSIDKKVICRTCDFEFEVDFDIEEGEADYGADADGNRGMYVPPSLLPPDDLLCPNCKSDCSKEAQAVADEWEPDDDMPDYEDDPEFDPPLSRWDL